MKYLFFILFFPVLLFASSPRCEYATLNNGIKVVFVKVAENPVISSTVVVKVGLKHETKEINGISHLLEHLMFNGTEKRTQRQLYNDFDAIGCYNNASTSDHYTAYYLLTSKEYFEKGIEIQSDMLLHSIIPADKIGKEKGIVIEEIRKDRMSPQFEEEKAFRKAIFMGTPYEMKVIGDEKSVKSLKRATIWNFYKRYYSPKNMVILISGDFEKQKVMDYLNEYFGNVKPVEVEGKNWEIKWEKDFEKINVPSLPYNVFYFVIKGVKANSKDFPLQECYTDLLNSFLNKKLTEIDPQASISTDYTDDYGLIKVRVKVKSDEEAKKVEKIVKSAIKNPDFITDGKIKEFKISSKADTLFALERPHFYGMLMAPYLAAGCTDLIYYKKVNYNDVKAFAEKVKNFDKKSVFIEGKKNDKKN
ncbi:hypothetical protein TTHT_1581 [Thermotomaculum hydrothermale]|uniref:Peptidase M16 domain protein n=1 Tax=Thermotomaculum hydrothermale TaxID=981385 RepID=A0A7R6PRM5_9BACT|nr:pitrilysin family protein [Thermotomaculum hydrothermale]BBB33071.1 hypothetical protein TTHT_1581 [Thermotomaculum hydrothermale]